MLVLFIIRKNIKRNSYISIFDNKISSYTLFNKRNLNLYTNDEMGYIGIRREIKNEVLYCIKQKIKNPKAQVRQIKQKILKAYGINTTKISHT